METVEARAAAPRVAAMAAVKGVVKVAVAAEPNQAGAAGVTVGLD